MIIKQRQEAGLSPRPPLAQFGQEMLRLDIAYYRETRLTDKPVFFDRGVVDALGLLDHGNAISPSQLEAHIREFRYNDVVFLMPPWPSIYTTDTQRDQTFSESIQVFESLSAWYEKWGYKTVEVPRVDVATRVEFILKTVEIALTTLV
jgi:predicted ATPase